MGNITKLTKEEKIYICEKMPVLQIKNYFQKNPKAFAEIKPGFRPDKMSDADTTAILKKNLEKPFISTFIEKVISEWLEDILDYRKKLESEGYTEGEALLKTLPDSYFCDNSYLYFKLAGLSTDEKYVDLFMDALSLIDKTKNEISIDKDGFDNSEEIKENENRIQELNDILDKKNKEYELIKKSYEEAQDEIKKHKDEIQIISDKLTKAEDTITTIQPELERYKYLLSYEDSEYEDTNRYQHVSVGSIFHDLQGTRWISRLADVVDGTIKIFNVDKLSPRYYENRDRLYWKDGPEKDGEIGVWGWRSDPNENDLTKDYVSTEYQEYARIVEIIEFPNCQTITELSKKITEKFEKPFSCKKILFVCNSSDGNREGLLCNEEDFEVMGNQIRLLPTIFTLREYSLQNSDILEINGKLFYNKMNLGIPQSVIRIRSPFEVVKKIVLKRVKVNTFREQGLTIKESQHCVNYLKEMQGDSLIQEIAEAYKCDESEAKQYLDDFIEQSETCLSGEDLDNATISSVLSRNQELIKRCKDLLTEEWKKDSEKEIESAKDELQRIEDDLEKKKEEEEKLTNKLQETQNNIAEKEELAKDVEEKIEKRIEDARKNAADFISQMAFLSPNLKSNSVVETVKKVDWIISSDEYEERGNIDDLETFEEELAENIIKCGFEENTAIEMSQIISFCIINGFPIVVRENTKMIADSVAGILGDKNILEVFVPISGIGREEVKLAFRKAEENNIKTILFHGVLDGYSNSVFNSILSQIRIEKRKICIILSIQGIDSNMLSSSIWNHSFFIDGDDALTDYKKGKLCRYNCLDIFDCSFDEKEFKEKRKEFKSFEEYLSNTSVSNYSKYLSFYGLSINTSMAIQIQLMAVAKSIGKEEQIKNILIKEGYLLEG